MRSDSPKRALYDSWVIEYEWRDEFDSAEVEALHAECFERQPDEWDWADQVDKHSLGWVCALDAGELVGWVNVAWDGDGHAFILDTIVAATHRRRGVATELVAAATDGAREAGCEWLHVDFEDHLLRSTSTHVASRRPTLA